MKRFPALIFATATLLCAWTGPVHAQDEYQPPYPHSTGAQLLPYCQATDTPVELLRCDYYVQGVADLATTPVNGQRLACIPRGKNRTELMELAVAKLSALEPEELEQTSAAALILAAFRKEFSCPKKTGGDKVKKAEINPALEEALRKALLEKAAKEKAEAGEASKQ